MRGGGRWGAQEDTTAGALLEESLHAIRDFYRWGVRGADEPCGSDRTHAIFAELRHAQKGTGEALDRAVEQGSGSRASSASAAALAGLAPRHPPGEGRPHVFSAPPPGHLPTYGPETLAEPGTNLRATACQARARKSGLVEKPVTLSDVEPYLTAVSAHVG